MEDANSLSAETITYLTSRNSKELGSFLLGRCSTCCPRDTEDSFQAKRSVSRLQIEGTDIAGDYWAVGYLMNDEELKRAEIG